MRPAQEIVGEIRRRLGFVPAHLTLAVETPGVLESLWQQTCTAFLDNPLPALLKERAFIYLSRWCDVAYCLVCHCCTLYAADEEVDHIAELLAKPDPRQAGALEAHLAVLGAAHVPLDEWPAPGSAVEHALLAVAAVQLLDRGLDADVQRTVQRLLGRERYLCWASFLGYVSAHHQWVACHPELSALDDERTRELLPRLLQEQPLLAAFLAEPGERHLTSSGDGAAHDSGHGVWRIFDAVPVGCVQVDASGTIRFANRQTAKIFGYERETLIGQQVESLVPARARGEHPGHRASFLRESSQRMMGADQRVYGLRKDGSEVPLEVGLASYGAGARRRAIAIIVDITAREQAKEALHRVSDARERLTALFLAGIEEERLYLDILDLLLELFESEFGFVGYIDEQGSLVCPSMTRHVWEQCEVPDKSVVFPRRIWGGLWGRVMLEKKCLIKNEAHQVPAGHLPIQRSMGAPLLYRGELIGMLHVANRSRDYDDTDRQVMAAVADQTAPLLAALQAEQALRRSNAELESFAYVASHDLQEPLRMVASYTEMLAHRYKGQLDDRADKYIQYAVDGAMRMQRLIQDILAFARIDSKGAPFETVDCERVLDRALGDLTMAIEGSEAEITRDVMPVLTADASQLTQVFNNLIGNALKFQGAAPPRIHVAARRTGSTWTFSVSDNGIGIEAEHAHRVFEMFRRLHGRGEYTGTGIGLALARKIVERHGGKIWLESQPGEGSTFHFTLPAEVSGGWRLPGGASRSD